MAKQWRFRLASGQQLLAGWSEAAGQARRNVAYRALFAVTDGSVFWSHEVLRDPGQPQAYFILVKADLVIKIRFVDAESFGIIYIGPPAVAPGLDGALEAA